MSLALDIRFELGRYHATPWDRHVNDGVTEWPPSPWRITRALYCIWKERCRELPESDVIEALNIVAKPPVYELPPGIGSSSRHYYPNASHRSGLSADTDKIIDAFVALDPSAPMRISWEQDVSSAAMAALQTLTEHLTYLGRAESCCNAELVTESQRSAAPSLGSERWVPDDSGPHMVLVPVTPIEQADLTITTDQMRKMRVLSPPGARRVGYSVEAGEPRNPMVQRIRSVQNPTALVVSISGRPSPHVTKSVVAMEWLRGAVIRRMGGGSAKADFSGHRPDGTHRSDQHQHSHFLPVVGSDGRIDSIVVWSQEGLPPDAVSAIAATRRCGPLGNTESYQVKGIAPFGVTTVALGGGNVIPGQLSGPATKWVSSTPFVPSRHQKARRYRGALIGSLYQEFVEEELHRELAFRSYPFAEVEFINSPIPAQRFRRHRVRESLGEAKQGVMVALSFDEPVGGPIALGRFSHFGLGLFRVAG